MKHRFLALAAAACLIPLRALGAGAVPAAIAPEVLKAEGERIAVMAASRSAVLAVFSRDGGGGGSGVVISPDGYALTNFHVVLPCGNAMKCGMSDGKLYDAVLVGIDPTGDVAMIKLFGRERFPAAEIGDSDGVQSGDWVFAMGNPFLLSTDFQPTVTYGIISGTHRYQYPAGTILEYTDCLQTDASINPGNSGGPLFDARGRLVGINGRASFYKRGRVSVGVGYAISINQVKNFLGILHGGRIADHATLGAVVGLDSENRVVVTDILESSDAYRRGLRYGDEIVSFGARAIETPNAFKNVLGILPKGWRVPLSFRRDGRRHNVLVRLQGLHSESELLERIAAEHEDSPMPIPKPGPGPEDKPGDRPAKGPGHDRGKKKPKDEFPDPQKAVLEALHRKAPLPAVVLKHFEEKRGYANYFFNKLNRDRIWKAWTARCDLAGQQGPWSISGRLPDGTPLRIALNAADALLKLPSRSWKWTAADPVDATLSPPGSGGLLMALSLWRRLAVEGPERFGDVSYLGSMPLPVRDGSGRDGSGRDGSGREGLVDVLSALHSGVECRFMFDPAEGTLLAIEMYTAEDSDPCEIYFSDYHEVGDRFLPQTMEVRYGDDAFGTFRLESYQFEKNL